MIRHDIRRALLDVLQGVVGDPIAIFEHVFRFGAIGHGPPFPASIALQETDLSPEEPIGRSSKTSSHFEVREKTSAAREGTFGAVTHGGRMQGILLGMGQFKGPGEERNAEDELVRRGAVPHPDVHTEVLERIMNQCRRSLSVLDST